MKNRKAYKLISKIMVVIYVMTLLNTVLLPIRVNAAAPAKSSSSSKSSSKSSTPKSSTSSSSKPATSSSKSSYSGASSSSKTSASSYSSSKTSSSTSKSTSTDSSKSTSSSSSSTKSSSGFLGKLVSSASKAISAVKSSVSNSYSSAKATVTKAAAAVKTAVAKPYTAVKTAVAKTTAAVKNTVASAYNKVVPAPVKKAVANVSSKVQTAVNGAKQKVTAAVNTVVNNVKAVGQSVAKTAQKAVATASQKFNAAVKAVSSVASNVKTSVKQLASNAKTVISSAQQKVKDAVVRYATSAGQSIKTGIQNTLNKAGQALVGGYNNAKQTIVKMAANPTMQRVAKGAMGVLQVAGGVVQTAGGVALSATGLGAVLGVPVAAHGISDVIQGSIKTFNAITGKKVAEINPMEEVYKFAGRAIGGEKGEAIAKKVFGVVDLGLGLVSPTKLIAKFEKINTLADAAKYLKSIPGQAVTNVGKGVAYLKTAPKELGKVASTAYKTVKSAPAAMAKGVDKLADSLNAAKKFAAGYKTTAANAVKKEYNIIKQAFVEGSKAYSKTARKTVTLSSNGAGELQKLYDKMSAVVKEYKDIKIAGISDVSKGGTGNDVYAGVKEASEFLKSQNIPREYRKQILESFDVRTIKMETAGDSTFGIRFYGGEAQEKGRYLFETFSPTTNRNNLALPEQWNTMSGLQQFKVESGTQMITGNAAPQLQYGSQYVGGAKQWYINSLEALSK